MSEDFIVSGPDDQEFVASLPNVSVGRYFWDRMLSMESDLLAEHCLETNISYTFKDMLIKGQTLARKLSQLGCKPSDIVVLCTGNNIICSACMLGCFWSGAICQTLFNKFPQETYELLLEISEPRVIITALEDYPRLKAACDNKGLSPAFIITDCPQEELSYECVSLMEIWNKERNLDQTFQPYDVPKEKLKEVCVLILSSSGSSGLPKGVQHSHASVLFNHWSHRYFNKNNEQGNIMTISGPFWVTGVIYRLWGLGMGLSNFILPKVTVEHIFSAVASFKIISFMVSPALFSHILKYDFSQIDISSLKQIHCGGAAISEKTLVTAAEIFKNIPVFQCYGMTEFIYIHNYNEVGHPGTIGKLGYESQGKVVSIDTGLNLPANSKGELCFKSQSVMMGYLKNPKATAEAIDEKGWLHSGDFGYYDEDGYFYIVDRIKSLIKYKGHHINATEIEDVLNTHPDIFESCVISIPHDVDWEHSKAYISLVPNSKLTNEEIHKYIKDRLPELKWLHGGIEVMDKLPKIPSGKMNRTHLKELHLKGLNTVSN